MGVWQGVRCDEGFVTGIGLGMSGQDGCVCVGMG